MAENENGVKKQTLYISIGVSLLIGFLSGIIYSDNPSQPAGPSVQQQAQQQQQNQATDKIASLQFAAQQNPNNAETWTQLGHAYFDSNQPAKAIEAYNKSLEIIPSNPPVLTDIGVMYRRNGQSDKALESFDKALQASPGFEQALFNKGIVLYNDLGDPAGAIGVWKELVLINPGARTPNGGLVTEMIATLSKQINQ